MILALSLAQLSTSFAAIDSACDPTKANPNRSFFGLPHWWQYIHTGQIDAFGHCTPQVAFPSGLWSIGLAIIDILLFLAGFIAVISIIVAGIEYLVTLGNAEKGVSARKRIVNSIIGLVIALVATGIVSFIGKNIGG